MRVQTEKAVREADAALFLIDARAGVMPLDEEIARWLRSEDTPIILCANKAEGKQGESGLMEAYSLGFDNVLALSAEHGEGLGDLYDALEPFAMKKAGEKSNAILDAELEVVARGAHRGPQQVPLAAVRDVDPERLLDDHQVAARTAARPHAGHPHALPLSFRLHFARHRQRRTAALAQAPARRRLLRLSCYAEMTQCAVQLRSRPARADMKMRWENGLRL